MAELGGDAVVSGQSEFCGRAGWRCGGKLAE